MDENNRLLKRIEDTAILLYQNKEHEGMGQMTRLLLQFQEMIQNLTEEQMQNVGNFALIMLKELMESYNCADMLGMADCLMVKATLLVQYIEETKK